MTKKRVKTGGRQKGTPNKTTAQLKKVIADFVSEKFESIERTYGELEEKEQLDFLVKLLPFVIQKKSEKTISLDEDTVSLVRDSMTNIDSIFKKG